jgi:hypothetical protein
MLIFVSCGLCERIASGRGRRSALRLLLLAVVASAIVCAEADLARSAASIRSASPSAVYTALAKKSFWEQNLPPGFRLATTQSERLTSKGMTGDVAVSLKGSWAGQGFGFVVTNSVPYARAGLSGVIQANHAKLVPGTPGTYEWQAVERGPSSACDSPKIRCNEYARVVRVRNTLVTAVVGASRPIDLAARRQVAALLAFAVPALHRAGG